MNAHEITQLCERTEALGWEGLFGGTPAAFAAQIRMESRWFESGVFALCCAGVPGTLFNRVMSVGIEAPLTETLLDMIIADYANAGVRQFALQICPDSQPADLLTWLKARGFTRGIDWAKVYRPATPPDPIPTDLRIAEIGVDQRDVYARTLCQGYGMPEFMMPMTGGVVGSPGWHNYIAYEGDQPVAIGALQVQGEIGWLGGGGTIPEFRRRGAQGALMTRRIQDGIALGCKEFVTETGAERPDRPNPSYHNMLRTGFQLAYLRTDYLSPAP